MKYFKTIRNTTSNALEIGLPIRSGEFDPTEVDSKVLWYSVGANESKVVELADQDAMAFLNGLYFKDGGQRKIVGFRVVTKGDEFCSTLNTNDTLTISAVNLGGIKVQGSNR